MAAGLFRLSVLTTCVALISAHAASAQDSSPWFTRAGFAPAYVVAANPFASASTPTERDIGAVPSMTIEIGRQTDGSRDWHHAYGLPSYGFGISIGSPGGGGGMSR